jgi:hypothetical protein
MFSATVIKTWIDGQVRHNACVPSAGCTLLLAFVHGIPFSKVKVKHQNTALSVKSTDHHKHHES